MANSRLVERYVLSGIVAVMVVAFHYSFRYQAKYKRPTPSGMYFLGKPGRVDRFFIISGLGRFFLEIMRRFHVAIRCSAEN